MSEFRRVLVAMVAVAALGWAAPARAGAPACPNQCSGHGACKGGKCVCPPEWPGDDCGTRSGCAGGCGHGMCKGGQCVCQPGWQGETCGTAAACPGGCGHGLCKGGQCVCPPGWKGESCQTHEKHEK